MNSLPSAASQVRWRILALITLASFVGYFLRSNMSVAGEAMMRDMSLSKSQLGVILAGFAWGYAAFQFPGAMLGERLGARRIIALCLVAWGVLNLLVGLIPAAHVLPATAIVAGLVALRTLMGIAQAPLFPVVGGPMTCAWFPVGGWALPLSLQNVGLTFGAAATPPVIAWLTQQYGWRASFLMTAPLGLVLALVWRWYVRDTPQQHAGVNHAELELIDANRPAFASGAPSGDAWKRILRDRDVMLLSLGYLCSNVLYYFFFNWLFIYLIENRGMKLLEGGFYAAAPWIAGAVGALIGGIVCDRLVRRIGARWGYRMPAIVGLTLSAAFILIAAAVSSPVIAVVMLSLCLASQQATEAPFWTAVIALSGRDSATATGVLNTGGNVAGGLGALLVPLLVDRFGWGAALASAALFALIGAAVWMAVDPSRELEKAATV